MPVRTAEFRLHLRVALVAKLWLLLHQQGSFRLRVVRGMATDTANVIAGMSGTGEVGVLVAIGMTAEAALVGFRHAQLLKDNDLALVATALDVRRSWTVAAFAIHPFAWGAGLETHLVVRCLFGYFVDVFVTALARFRANVLPRLLRVGRRLGLRRALWSIECMCIAQSCNQQEGTKQERKLPNLQLHLPLRRESGVEIQGTIERRSLLHLLPSCS